MPSLARHRPLKRYQEFCLLGVIVAVIGLLASPQSPAARAVGPDLPYHLSLPGVSADSQPSPEPEAVTTRHVAQDVDGSLVVTGEVHNGTAGTVGSVVVSATANGTSRNAVALAYELAPGADALFQVTLPGITDIKAAVTTAVVSYATLANPSATSSTTVTLSGVRALQVTVTDPNTGRTTVSDSTTVLVVVGTLTNTGTQALDSLNLVLGIYDEAGDVRLVAITTAFNVPFRDSADRSLQPGSAGTFEVPVPRAKYFAISGTVHIVAYFNGRPVSP